MPKDKNLPAHHVEKGDPKVNGPFLDDVRAAQEDEYRKHRMRNIDKQAEDDTPVAEDADADTDTSDSNDSDSDIPVVVQNEHGEFVINNGDNANNE